jgi:hypothetical protein
MTRRPHLADWVAPGLAALLLFSPMGKAADEKKPAPSGKPETRAPAAPNRGPAGGGAAPSREPASTGAPSRGGAQGAAGRGGTPRRGARGSRPGWF